jgi:hypothetical protein
VKWPGQFFVARSLAIRSIPKRSTMSFAGVEAAEMSNVTELLKRFHEYLQRHDTYYPNRHRMEWQEFVVWDQKWDREYEKLWDALEKWMDEHGKFLTFASAPQWPEISKLEEMLCV